MRRTPILIAALAVALPLATGGCSGVKETLGLTKQSPDEFKVVSRAPLSMPPDYNLRPPTPGAPRPQEGTPRDQAQQAVLGIAPDAIPPIGEGEESEAAQSSGESALLQSAGATGVDPNIRQLVDTETAEDEADSKTLADTLVFWREPEPYGTWSIRPSSRSACRKSRRSASRSPRARRRPIVRKKKGALEGLF